MLVVCVQWAPVSGGRQQAPNLQSGQETSAPQGRVQESTRGRVLDPTYGGQNFRGGRQGGVPRTEIQVGFVVVGGFD